VYGAQGLGLTGSWMGSGLGKVFIRPPHFSAAVSMGSHFLSNQFLPPTVSPLSSWRYQSGFPLQTALQTGALGSSLSLHNPLHGSLTPFTDVAYFPWRTGTDSILSQQAPWLAECGPQHRGDAVETIMFYKHQKQVSFAQIAQCLGRSETWTCAALLGQATLSPLEVETLMDYLNVADPKIRHSLKIILTQPALKGVTEGPMDPTVYRFYEILQVYGSSFKALINEKFGDGVMSAVDLTVDLDKEKRADGEYVKVVLQGKFLPYKKW